MKRPSGHVGLRAHRSPAAPVHDDDLAKSSDSGSGPRVASTNGSTGRWVHSTVGSLVDGQDTQPRGHLEWIRHPRVSQDRRLDEPCSPCRRRSAWGRDLMQGE